MKKLEMVTELIVSFIYHLTSDFMTNVF